MSTNFLSGSYIDNITFQLFNTINSGNCYLGFSRGNTQNQWGMNALLQIETSNFPSDVVITSTNDIINLSKKFNDINTLKYVNPNGDRSIFIRKYANTDIGLQSAIDFGNVGNNLQLIYINSDWALISGLSYDYYSYMTYSSSASYYITNSDSSVAVKISNKYLTKNPLHIINCKLYMITNGIETLVKDNLQRVSNVLGETYVKGMREISTITENDIDYIFNMNVSAAEKKNIINQSQFILRDNSGNILFENMIFNDPNSGNLTELYQESTITTAGISQKFLQFKYTYSGFNTQYIKFLIGSNDINEVAIWNEALPYKTAIPISDVNPPAIDVTYLKNPSINTSIFDINGLVKIDPTVNGEVQFIKEIYSSAMSAEYNSKGFDIKTLEVTGNQNSHYATVKKAITKYDTTNIIEIEDNSSFVIGDYVYIKYNPNDGSVNTVENGITYKVIEVDRTPANSFIKLDQNLQINTTLFSGTKLISNITNVLTKMILATTKNRNLAIKNSFFNVMIKKSIPLSGSNSPTEGIYRQLFICYSPSNSGGELCNLPTYNNDLDDKLFNKSTWSYNIGMLMYVANKITFYRKWALNNEEITIIL